jgi:secreted trypsin-like serine protease
MLLLLLASATAPEIPSFEQLNVRLCVRCFRLHDDPLTSFLSDTLHCSKGLRFLGRMKVLPFFASTSALAALLTSVHSYSFSDFSKTPAPVEKSTGLTTNQESRVIGGADAEINNYPYVASVRIDGVTVCAATLIAPQYLVTTAHCIKTDDFSMVASFDTEYSVGNGGDVVKIVEGYKHPKYNKKKHLYDVGLFKLEKPMKLKIAALPAADGSDEKIGAVATVLGWGQTEEKGANSLTLQQADLPIISNAKCGKFPSYKEQLTEGVLCAGTGKGKGSCRGDAGGPLIANNAVVGFVSWTEGKCGEVPGVYTRVSYVLDYIDSIVTGGGDSRSSASGSIEEVAIQSSTSGLLETTADKAFKETETTTVSTTDFSSGSASQNTPSTKGLTFSFDGSAAAQKDTSKH